MRVTLFIGSLSGGGAERVVCSLANHLSKNHTVTVLTMANKKPIIELNPSIRVVSLLEKKTNFLSDNCRRYFSLKRYIKKKDADCYVAFLPKTICLLLHFRKLIGVPVIISERNYPPSYPFLGRFLLKHYAKLSDAVVCQTQSISEWYSGFVASKPYVIPNAINESFCCEEQKEPIFKKRIVAVGRLEKQKNYDLLIDSFSSLPNSLDEYTLEIYGEGSEKSRLISKIKKLKLTDRVVFKGFSYDIKESILGASLYVLSSNYEGMPNTLMEALALGIPCISTDCDGGGARFLIRNGYNGLLVSKNNKTDLTNAIIRVLSSPSFSSFLSKNARGIIDDLNHSKIYSTWSDIITQVADRK